MDISEAGKHISAAEFGLVYEPDSSARVTWESEEPNVSGGS